MNDFYSHDQESLQKVLANAFAVQTCGLDRESLCALIELERFITTGDFDEDRVLQMVTDHALKVSNASGVSIALFQGNELVYRAGSGSAASDLGHHVPAVLSVSPEAEAIRREILRVENAQTDTRVEADVCRQFGATSLLMLPIYQKPGLAGVMQVLFDDAHAFLDREIRTYRLMVGVLEERILTHPHRAQQQTVRAAGKIACDRIDLQYQPRENVKPLVILPGAVEQDKSRWGASETHDGREVHAVRKPVRSVRAFVLRKWNAFSRKFNAAIWKDVDRPPNVHLWYLGTAVTVAIIVALAIWASYDNRPTPVTTGFAFSTARGLGRQAPGQSFSIDNTTKQVSNKSKDTAAPNSAFRRVRIGPNEVDYVAEDVTIRHFRTAPVERQTRRSEKEVNFGDDVTVRYFAYTPTTVATPRPSSAAIATTKTVTPVSR